MSSILYNQLKAQECLDEILKIINLAKKQGEYDTSYTFPINVDSNIINPVISHLEEYGYNIKYDARLGNKIYVWWED